VLRIAERKPLMSFDGLGKPLNEIFSAILLFFSAPPRVVFTP